MGFVSGLYEILAFIWALYFWRLKPIRHHHPSGWVSICLRKKLTGSKLFKIHIYLIRGGFQLPTLLHRLRTEAGAMGRCGEWRNLQLSRAPHPLPRPPAASASRRLSSTLPAAKRDIFVVTSRERASEFNWCKCHKKKEARASGNISTLQSGKYRSSYHWSFHFQLVVGSFIGCGLWIFLRHYRVAEELGFFTCHQI